MIQDNQIIKGRAVYEWRQLAQKHQVPHATPEELGEFIDNYHALHLLDYLNKKRETARRIEDIRCIQEFKEVLLSISDMIAKLSLTHEQLDQLEANVDFLEHQMHMALQFRPLS